MRKYFWNPKICANICTNKSQKINHAAKVFAIFCANICTLQVFSQKFAQKKAQIFYGSYLPARAYRLWPKEWTIMKTKKGQTMPELRSAEAAISETMFYMSFSLGFRLLKDSQSTSSCSKAPARAYRLWPKE